jgi:hypothetical protein
MYNVVVTYSSGAAWGTGMANVIELRNVDQTTPVANGTAVPNALDCTGVARSLPITVSQPGSFLYGFAAGRNASSIAITTGSPQTQTFNGVETSPSLFRAAGGRHVASSNTTFQWDMAGCWSSVLVGVTVRRVGVP